ncbi:TetR/AcrR family transcriptional regulator [Leisingera sp. ANG59]|uniref:TetR/AcrR family transcriptional regulator n=1 Tax=Leisingera sp. ANG59 TaxID=2675221 RepID=UPI0015739D62|nr:TetR/AcrR family transcriptional regulator [Leisingera sp. ANG59]NSY40629.1 TetR family transcriptional regulator [Leisingera sp. ANG59]
MAGRGRPRNFDREKALSVAMRLFWERGYDATSLADLTAGMGISTSSLAAAFSSKENLFLEAVKLYTTMDASETGRELAAQNTARHAVASVLHRAARNMTQKDKPSSCLLMLGAINTSPKNYRIIDYMINQRHTSTDCLRRRIARGVADGDVPPDADVDAIADYYSAMIRGMAIKARDGASRGELIRIAELAMLSWDAVVSVRHEVLHAKSSDA